MSDIPRKNIWARIRENLARREIKRLPKGAMKFPTLIQSKMGFDWNEVKQVMDNCNASELFLFHGNAMKVGSKAVVVTGPQGIGKSSALMSLEGKKLVEPLSDGDAIVAKTPKGFFVIGSGNYPNEKRYFRIGRVLRGGRLYRSPFASRKTNGLVFWARRKVKTAIARATNTIYVLTLRDKSGQTIKRPLVPLGKIIFIEHENDSKKPNKVNGEKIWEIENEEAKREFQGQAKVVAFSSFKKGLQKQLQKEILS